MRAKQCCCRDEQPHFRTTHAGHDLRILPQFRREWHHQDDHFTLNTDNLTRAVKMNDLDIKDTRFLRHSAVHGKTSAGRSA